MIEVSPLGGKIALVTGGSRGIGAATTARLAMSGATVVFTYNRSGDAARELVNQLEREGCQVKAMAADSSSSTDIASVVAQTVSAFKRIDILVNNASQSARGRIEEMDLSAVDALIAVNVRGPYCAIREVLPHMPQGGRVINIGSVSSSYMPYVGNSLYVMTKGAVEALTRGLARELAERGIRINTIQPGRIETDMLHESLGDKYDGAEEAMPLGRFGQPGEVARFVEFLCGPGGDIITGTSLKIDGGVSV